MATPSITFLTDFGTADYFVGAMKGALLAVCPDARVFDLSHDIPPQDIAAGAFTLLAAHETWPVGTIHVAVVDPGVGTLRRPLVVLAGGHYFVGPDNGLFSLIYERYATARAWHITNTAYFRQPVNPSFHGRDVFAPVAGTLANGVTPAELGPEITDYVQFEIYAPPARADGYIAARIIHIDRFGNCLTNITPRHLATANFRLEINGHSITRLCSFLAEGATDNALFAIWGSAGYLEISLYCDSAAQFLGAERGTPVRLEVTSQRSKVKGHKVKGQRSQGQRSKVKGQRSQVSKSKVLESKIRSDDFRL